MLRNVMTLIAYDGADFHGWQTQPGMRTVQDCFEQALRRVLRHRVVVFGAGRTDSGVHAAGQVANFFTTSPAPLQGIFHATGSRVPKDMSIIRMDPVPLTFHATHTAVCKLYRYRIHNKPGRPCANLTQRFVYHYWRPLDINAMRRAASAWIGTHDFTSFASSGNVRSTNVRTISRIDVYREGLEIRVDVIGTGFLYNQVRNMVGTLIEFGRGHWPAEQAADILAARDRKRAGPTAPANGLCMQWVKYDIPGLPEPTQATLDRVAGLTGPVGVERADVDGRPISTAPLPPDYDIDEEPGG